MKRAARISAAVIGVVLIIAPVFSFIPPDRAEARYYVDTVYVDASRPDDSGDGTSWATALKSLREGVDLVSNGGTVYVAAGTYVEPYTIDIIEKSCTIIGAGAPDTIIDGGGSKTVIYIRNLTFTATQEGGTFNDRPHETVYVTISGFTVQNGRAEIVLGEEGGFSGGMPCGGGIYVSYDSRVTLNDCVIKDCTSNFIGGGIYNAGQLTMNRCTISGNYADAYGGGIVNFADHPDHLANPLHATLSLVNCTISGNSVASRGFRDFDSGEYGWYIPFPMGGGVLNGATASFLNVTLANNTAPQERNYTAGDIPTPDVPRGAGLANVPMQCANDQDDPLFMPVATFKNTIVAGNTWENCYNTGGGTVTSLGNNIDSDSTCGFGLPTDLVNVNPQLDPLQDNGGQTPTCAITKTSAAYNHANPSAAPDTDQRGYSRPQGICSIGAFEPLRSDGSVGTSLGGVKFSLDHGSFDRLAGVRPENTPCGTPAGYDFPFGLFSFKIENITTGQTVKITIKFPRRLPYGYIYYKCVNGTLVDCTANTTRLDDYTLVLSIKDGGPCDADGLANGFIIDPGGPAERTAAAAPVYGQGTIPATVPQQAPVALSSISVMGASLSATKVAPGAPVTVTADVVNTGTANGTGSIQVYVNGEAETTQGVTIPGGGSTPVSFTVSRNEPGAYSVYVGGKEAGVFEVDPFANNGIFIYGIMALFMLGIAATLYFILRKRTV